MSKKPTLTPARKWAMNLMDEVSKNAFRERFQHYSGLCKRLGYHVDNSYSYWLFNKLFDLREDAALLERECHKPAPESML